MCQLYFDAMNSPDTSDKVLFAHKQRVIVMVVGLVLYLGAIMVVAPPTTWVETWASANKLIGDDKIYFEPNWTKEKVEVSSTDNLVTNGTHVGIVLSRRRKILSTGEEIKDQKTTDNDKQTATVERAEPSLIDQFIALTCLVGVVFTVFILIELCLITRWLHQQHRLKRLKNNKALVFDCKPPAKKNPEGVLQVVTVQK